MTADSDSLLARQKKILNSRTPLLPSQELTDFVAAFIKRRDLYLQALERHRSPIYLQESSVLKSRARQFKQAFQQRLPSAAFYFAVKSNNHPNVAGVLLEEGFGLDVSSGQELEMVLELDARQIIFSGPGKTDQELRLAAAHADRVVVLMDSFGELRRLACIAAEEKQPVRCGVRLTIDPSGLWRKFGIAPQSLPAFWKEASQYRHIHLRGLQFHSSWNLSPHVQIRFTQILGKILRDMPAAYRSQIEFVDIGGGYWPAQGEWLQPAGTPAGNLRKALEEDPGDSAHHHRLPAVGISEFSRDIAEALEHHLFRVLSNPCRIFLEPGRWICNDAVHLLITVVDKKAADLVVTDAGTNAVGWERFETDYFPILNLTRPALVEKKCDILGSLCTPHDVWGYMYFGDGIESGDILMIPTQGAYTYSLRQNFIKPLPTVCMI
jgi:diaminopimelate decarboxylase